MIRKQDFYEGAALYLLACEGQIEQIRYQPPFFLLNGEVSVYLKYSTRGRSPWGFTFMPDEAITLKRKTAEAKVVIALVCGSDGVAALSYKELDGVAPFEDRPIRVACFRLFNEHYEIRGPKGIAKKKVPPSRWKRILIE